MTKDEILETLTYDERLGRFKHKGTPKRAGYTNDITGQREILLHGTAYLESDLVWFLHTGFLPETPLAHLNGKITNNRFTTLSATLTREEAARQAREEARQVRAKAREAAETKKKAAKAVIKQAKREATEKRRAIAAEKKAEEARNAYQRNTEARRLAARETGMVQHEPTPAGLTHEMLQEILVFDTVEGRFRYLPRPDTEFNHTKFNRKYAGQLAGDERKGGYRTIFIKGKRYLESMIAWFYYKGAWPVTPIGHYDGDRRNIREANLGIADLGARTDVRPRRKRKNADNTSGYAGVSWCKTRGKYLVHVRRGGKQYYGGAFDDVHLAGAKATAMYAALGLEDTGA
jgi:hypothetical protein